MLTRVIISLPQNLLDKIDNLAEEEELTRSALVREALCFYETNKEQIRERRYKLA